MPSLQLNSNIIERENSLKFLGTILDKHLTWKKHIQLIESNVSRNIGGNYDIDSTWKFQSGFDFQNRRNIDEFST